MNHLLKNKSRQFCICVADQPESMVMRVLTIGEAVCVTSGTGCLLKKNKTEMQRLNLDG